MGRIAFLVAAEGIERVELTEPWKAVEDAGHEPVLVSPDSGEVQTFNHLTAADNLPVDEVVADASVDEFAALVLPGGVANN
jgi:protease I